MRRFLVATALLAASPSLAQQQQPDPNFLKHAIAAVERQRNQALAGQALAEARASALDEDLAKAKDRIKELEAAVSAPDKAGK